MRPKLSNSTSFDCRMYPKQRNPMPPCGQVHVKWSMLGSIFVFFGLILMIILSQPDPQIYYSYSGFFLLISIILVFVAIFFGPEINGANRWISFGFVTLQPSELCKIFLPIFIASYLYGVKLPINLKNTFLTIILIFIVFLNPLYCTKYSIF